MWADIETEVDMLNFAVVANTAAELIKESSDPRQNNGQHVPLKIT